MSKLSAVLTANQVAACRHDRREDIVASNGVRRSRKELHDAGRPTINGATDAFSLLSCASGPFRVPILKVAFGEGFRAPALCDGGTAPGAGARKPPKEETAGR
jgi:hypothetical protein